jgi:putative membrane protein
MNDRAVTDDKRWPRSVYRAGDEPDVRFSLANERTMLAWIRTALGLVAAGVVADAVQLPLPDLLRRILAGLLVVLGAVAAMGGWLRWARVERALRERQPLPAPSLAAVIVGGLAVVTVVTLLVIVVR